MQDESDGDDGIGSYLEDGEEEARVELVPGEGYESVMATDDVSERAARLAEWEAQLFEYNQQLSEDHWKTWKEGKVTSIMAELQRKVMPDAWRDEVERANDRIASLEQQLERAAQKEAALVKRIDELENGPGCARELREELDQLKENLSRQRQRERQRFVMAELLTSAAAGAGSGRAAAIAALEKRGGGGGGDGGGGPAVAALEKPGSGGGGGGAGSGGAELPPEVRSRTADLQRQLSELRAELDSVKSAHEGELKSVKSELETEKGRHRTARDALEQVHVEAGIHEAQEMTQLRMELSALTEEVEFLRSREEAVQQEEARMHMVAEMNKKLGANVSRYELEALHTQVASLTKEAQRVQAANLELQKDLGQRTRQADELESLKAEVAAFQAANDRLEGELVKAEEGSRSLETKLASARMRSDLLERQLIACHQPGSAAAAAIAARVRGGGGGNAGRADAQPGGASLSPSASSVAVGTTVKGAMPLLWHDWATAAFEGRTSTHHTVAAVPTLRSAGRPIAGGGGDIGDGDDDDEDEDEEMRPRPPVAQRALMLQDELGAQRLRATVFPAPQPTPVRRPPPRGEIALLVRSNAAELAAAAARKEEAAAAAERQRRALLQQQDADVQETRVWRASSAALQLRLRADKLAALRHYWWLGMMRALRRWALLLELGDAYAAAVGAASDVLLGRSDEVVAALGRSQKETVRVLMLAPELLEPLGGVRHRLQTVLRDAEELSDELHEMRQRGVTAASARLQGLLPEARGQEMLLGLAEMVAAAAAPMLATRSPWHAAGRQVGVRELEAERLANRLLLVRWRRLKRATATTRARLEARDADLLRCAEQLERVSEQALEAEAQLREHQARDAQRDVALAAAAAAASSLEQEHEEEVHCLSEKLRQLVEEKTELQQVCAQQAADLKVLSTFVASHGASRGA